jgi:hypothetical protein
MGVQYYLKAAFNCGKDQLAVVLLITLIAQSLSQVLWMNFHLSGCLFVRDFDLLSVWILPAYCTSLTDMFMYTECIFFTAFSWTRNSEVLHNVIKRELRETEMGVGWCSWCYCLCCCTCLGRGLFFALVYWAMVYKYDF